MEFLSQNGRLRFDYLVLNFKWSLLFYKNRKCAAFFFFFFREREGCILVADLVAFVIFHVVYFSLTLWDNALVCLGTLLVINLVRSLVLAQRMSPSVLLFSLCVLCVRVCVCV